MKYVDGIGGSSFRITLPYIWWAMSEFLGHFQYFQDLIMQEISISSAFSQLLLRADLRSLIFPSEEHSITWTCLMPFA